MKFGSLAIRVIAVVGLLIIFSLARAITFPAASFGADIAGVGLSNLILILVVVFAFTMVGQLCGVGIRSYKKTFSPLLFAFAGALAMGGILAGLTSLNIPYMARVNFGWLGSDPYDPLLTVFLIGAPIMLVFLVGE